jgi:hypothetical protein
MAPVELVGFSRRKAQRDVGSSRRLSAFFAPPSGVTAHGIVAAIIPTPAQLFKDPDQRQVLARSLASFPASNPSSSAVHRPNFGRGLQHAPTRMRSLPTSAPSGPCSAIPSGHGRSP